MPGEGASGGLPPSCRPLEPVALDDSRWRVRPADRSALHSSRAELEGMALGSVRLPTCSRRLTVTREARKVADHVMTPCCDVLQRHPATLRAFVDRRARLLVFVLRYRGQCVEIGYAREEVIIARSRAALPPAAAADGGAGGLSFAVPPDDVDLASAFEPWLGPDTAEGGARQYFAEQVDAMRDEYRVRKRYRRAAALARNGRRAEALRLLTTLACDPAWVFLRYRARADQDLSTVEAQLPADGELHCGKSP